MLYGMSFDLNVMTIRNSVDGNAYDDEDSYCIIY